MNVGVALIAMILIFAASIGLVVMAQENSQPVTDTMGKTLSLESNNTHQVITETSAPIAQVGGIFGIAIACITVCGLLVATVALVYVKKGPGKSSYSSARR